MSNDGWKFAEELLGLTAEALKRAREGVKFPTWTAMRQHEAAGMCPGCDGRDGEHWTECGVLYARRAGEKRVEDKLWDVLPAGQRGHVTLKDALREVAEAVEDAKKWRERETTVADIQNATERLVRWQVADRLVAILFPDASGPRPVWALDEALAEVERRVGALRTPLDNIKAEVRDAALEEAATAMSQHCPLQCDVPPLCFGCSAARAIRALKSKPAKPPKCAGLAGACRYAEKHDGLCVPTMDFPRPAPVQCLVPGCDRPHQHEGPHELTKRKQEHYERYDCGYEDLAGRRCFRFTGHPGDHYMEPVPCATQPVVHDIGWARARVMEGKRVRSPSTYPDGFERNARICLREDAFEATDWEVAE